MPLMPQYRDDARRVTWHAGFLCSGTQAFQNSWLIAELSSPRAAIGDGPLRVTCLIAAGGVNQPILSIPLGYNLAQIPA